MKRLGNRDRGRSIRLQHHEPRLHQTSSSIDPQRHFPPTLPIAEDGKGNEGFSGSVFGSLFRLDHAVFGKGGKDV